MVSNQLKTVILLALLTALLLFVGDLLGGFNGLVFAFVFVVLMNWGSYFFSDKIVLAMYKAKEVTESNAPQLFKITREIAQMSSIPMPKIYIIPSKSPNAFATGRNPKHAAVAATEGILELLSEKELKGVIAHEIAHIKNRDTLIQTITGMIAGIISYVGVMARWSAIFGGFGDRDKGNNIIEFLVLAIITPLIATIIQLAISRSREFLADETAAKTIHDGHGLASALKKLDEKINIRPLEFGNSSTAHLFIHNPFKGNGFFNLFSTHPSTSERVKKLEHMKV